MAMSLRNLLVKKFKYLIKTTTQLTKKKSYQSAYCNYSFFLFFFFFFFFLRHSADLQSYFTACFHKKIFGILWISHQDTL